MGDFDKLLRKYDDFPLHGGQTFVVSRTRAGREPIQVRHPFDQGKWWSDGSNEAWYGKTDPLFSEDPD